MSLNNKLKAAVISKMGFSVSISSTPVFSLNQSASVCTWEKLFDADKTTETKTPPVPNRILTIF